MRASFLFLWLAFELSGCLCLRCLFYAEVLYSILLQRYTVVKIEDYTTKVFAVD